jgi:hypothetical protein
MIAESPRGGKPFGIERPGARVSAAVTFSCV